MRTSKIRKAVLQLIVDKMTEVNYKLRCASNLAADRKGSMWGFKPEDYDYPDVTVRECEDKVEEAQEEVDNWNEIHEYVKGLFNA